MLETKLTRKQEDFCLFYFTLKNGTQAAIRAGYPENSAMQIAEQNLRKLDIQARLKELQSHQPPSPDVLIAFQEERKRLLSKIARHEIETPVGPGHITQAISELNKMEHVYETGNVSFNEIKIMVVRADDGKVQGRLDSGNKIIEIGDGQNAVEQGTDAGTETTG